MKSIAVCSLLLMTFVLSGCGQKDHGWTGEYELQLNSSAPAALKEQQKNVPEGLRPNLVIDEKAGTLKLFGNELTIVAVTDTELTAEGTGAFLELLAKIGGNDAKDSKVTLKFEKDSAGVYSVVKNRGRVSAWTKIAD